MESLASKRVTSGLQLLGIGALVLLFLITVMTAVAQQEAMARMEKEELQLGYSSAYAMVRALDERGKELPELRLEEKKLARQHASHQSAFRRAKDRLDTAWQAFLPVSQRISLSRRCEGSIVPGDDLGSRLGRWNEVKECVASNALPPALASTAKEVMGGNGNVQTAYEGLSKAYDMLTTSNEQLQSLRDRINEASAMSVDEGKARRSFAEMNVLRDYWMLGRGALVPFPPPMLQVLLAFVSGAFGALLVTLVLIVYPNTKFDMTAGQETWARILLGGLIAVCVYIVLLGGSAVLGSSAGISAAGTNYMAFCAIGILAGMFSDRVAFWLSDKADAFFKRAEPDVG